MFTAFCYSGVSSPSSALSLTDEWACLSDLDSPCLCQHDVGLTPAGGAQMRWEQGGDVETDEGSGVCAEMPLTSLSSGSPSPWRVRPAPAFHSNLMIMIFAQDDLCLHSVITPQLSMISAIGNRWAIRGPHQSLLLSQLAFRYSAIRFNML